MQVNPRALRMMFMIGLLLGTLAVPGVAAPEETTESALPRSFQGARLGMPLSDLAAIAPDANRASLGRHDQSQRTVVVQSKDRYLRRIEYRFYNDHLRELAIYYNSDKVPGGYQRLLERLRESYGNPIVVDQPEEYGLVRRTVWKDRTTMSSLVESHKIIDDKAELILTIADLALQQAFEEDQEHRRRQRELSIPIPLPDHSIQNRRTALFQSDQLYNRHTGG